MIKEMEDELVMRLADVIDDPEQPYALLMDYSFDDFAYRFYPQHEEVDSLGEFQQELHDYLKENYECERINQNFGFKYKIYSKNPTNISK